MQKRKVYISYDYANERPYKNLLLAWNVNEEFEPLVTDSEIYSEGAEDISHTEKTISDKIAQASVFLVIIGEITHQNQWVKWEIDKAVYLNKPIIAVKTKSENIVPDGLHRVKVIWAESFAFQAISNAIKES